MSPIRPTKKKDLLSYSDLNRLMPQNNLGPDRDSLGDSDEDSALETLVGMDYDEESEEDLRDPDEDEMADDLPDEEKIKGEDVEELDDDERVISSKRPGA